MLQNENAGNKSYRILADRSRMTKQQWEDLRQNYIGGSDAAAVIGISRFRSPLSVYLEKKSLVKKEPQNERMLWGVRIEPLLRERFQELTGYEVRELKYVLQSVENSFAIANLDGIVNLGPAEGNQWACLELKCVNEFTGNSDDFRGGAAGYISPEYYAQIQHYLYITGLNTAFLGMLIGGNRFVYNRISRDDEAISNMIRLEKHWYEQYFLTNTPAPAGPGDGELLGKFYDRPERKEVQLPESAAALVDDYLSATQEIKKWEERKKLAQVKLEEMIGNNGDTAVVGLRRINWKPFETKRFSASRAKEMNLLTDDQIDQCSTISSSRRFSVTTIKAKNK